MGGRGGRECEEEGRERVSVGGEGVEVCAKERGNRCACVFVYM